MNNLFFIVEDCRLLFAKCEVSILIRKSFACNLILRFPKIYIVSIACSKWRRQDYPIIFIHACKKKKKKKSSLSPWKKKKKNKWMKPFLFICLQFPLKINRRKKKLVLFPLEELAFLKSFGRKDLGRLL